MSDRDGSCVLGPLTPTHMPYFLPHRSPLHSSSNTRQRDDYEQGSQFCPSSPSPQVFVTSEDDEDYDTPPSKPDKTPEGGYPASELPFASEPALEGELEQGLPPLKKLKPDDDFDINGTRLDQTAAQKMVLIGAVKGILTRRTGTGTPGDSSSIPQSPLASGSPPLDSCFIPWSRSSVNPTNNLSFLTSSSAPLSRRSSSGASSVCTGSLKAVRFASGNLTNGWNDLQQSQSILPGEIEGPVAAVMYLTHSAEAYDRSPIVVEDGLRLPPRAKPEDDVDEPTMLLDKKRRAKLNVEILKVGRNRLGQLCHSPQSLSPQGDYENQAKVHNEEGKKMKNKTTILINKTYREVEEVDEEEEEETIGPGSFVDENEKVDEDDDEEAEENHLHDEFGHSVHDVDLSDDDDENDNQNQLGLSRSRVSNNETWGLGKWSSGEVFGCCDALGGF